MADVGQCLRLVGIVTGKMVDVGGEANEEDGDSEADLREEELNSNLSFCNLFALSN